MRRRLKGFYTHTCFYEEMKDEDDDALPDVGVGRRVLGRTLGVYVEDDASYVLASQG